MRTRTVLATHQITPAVARLAGVNEGWRNICEGGETRAIIELLIQRLGHRRSVGTGSSAVATASPSVPRKPRGAACVGAKAKGKRPSGRPEPFGCPWYRNAVAHGSGVPVERPIGL